MAAEDTSDRIRVTHRQARHALWMGGGGGTSACWVSQYQSMRLTETIHREVVEVARQSRAIYSDQ